MTAPPRGSTVGVAPVTTPPSGAPSAMPRVSVMSDRFTWQLHDAAGATLPTEVSVFPTQAEAEAWLGEEWTLLLEDGVESVTLVEGDAPVYGPMSLRGEQ